MKKNYGLTNDLHQIRLAFARTANDLKGKTTDMLSDSVDHVKDKTIHIQSKMSHFLSERLFASLAGAMLSGALITAYFNNNKKKRRSRR